MLERFGGDGAARIDNTSGAMSACSAGASETQHLAASRQSVCSLQLYAISTLSVYVSKVRPQCMSLLCWMPSAVL